MAALRRRFRRPLGERRYKKLFVIATEGTKTEPLYFSRFDSDMSVVRVCCLRGKRGSSPPQVLRRMTDFLEREGLRQTDEAWLVVDRDCWTDEQLHRLNDWSRLRHNHGMALSNPSFEYWLLLHFEDGLGVRTLRECVDRLRRWLPSYDKGFDRYKICQDQIEAAIRRAKTRDKPMVEDWPRDFGQTTVYRLVDRILGGPKAELAKV